MTIKDFKSLVGKLGGSKRKSDLSYEALSVKGALKRRGEGKTILSFFSPIINLRKLISSRLI